MTLIDTRPGIAAVWDALAAETGVAIDSADAGQPARAAAGRGDGSGGSRPSASPRWATGSARSTRRSPSSRRRPSPAPAPRSTPCTGTADGSWSSPASTGPTPSCTSTTSASRSTSWSAGSGGRTRRRRCASTARSIYVGDHLGDIDGCPRRGRASASRVATGPISADELRAAGADVVLDDLDGFPAWLDEHVLESRLAALDAQLAALGSGRRGVLRRRRLGVPARPRPSRALGPDNVLAATAVSGSLPDTELAAAARVRRRPRRPPRDAGHPRDGPRGLRAPTPATGATSARPSCSTSLRPLAERARPSPTSRPAPTPTTPWPASGRASGRPPSAARSRRCATPGSPRPRCAPRAGGWGCRRGTSPPRPACPAGSPTASRSPRPGWRGSTEPRRRCGPRWRRRHRGARPAGARPG